MPKNGNALTGVAEDGNVEMVVEAGVLNGEALNAPEKETSDVPFSAASSSLKQS